MKRILVTGNAGSGKTTVAEQVGWLLDIPCHSLDGIVWQSRWKKTPHDERDRLIRDLTKQDFWVIDGVSYAVQAEADMVVFLDLPRRVSFWRVFKRNWRYLFRSRPGLPSGCPEILVIPALVRIIWNFPAKIRPRIVDQASQNLHAQGFYHLRTQADLSAFLDGMADQKSRRGAALPQSG